MARILILNGPPGVGKDTIAGMLERLFGMQHMQFKTPLIKISAAIAGVSYQHLRDLNNNRDEKELPQEDLGGMTPRQLLIQVSEDVIKPTLGNDFFGNRLRHEINTHYPDQDIVFSDGGFEQEVDVLRQDHDVVVIRLRRDGFDFSGDSRRYIKHGVDYLIAPGEDAGETSSRIYKLFKAIMDSK